MILDEACSSPILLPSGSAGSDVTLLVRNDSILLEPRLLLLLMRAWRHFDTDEVSGKRGKIMAYFVAFY